MLFKNNNNFTQNLYLRLFYNVISFIYSLFLFLLSFSFLLLLLSLLFFKTTFVHAAGFDIAVSAKIEGVKGEDGDIVSFTDGVYKPSSIASDNNIYGVVVANPDISIEDQNLTEAVLIISSGLANVKVSTSGGNIKKGDFITSSDIAGIGQKSGKSGYVLGIATEDYSSESSTNVGKIKVLLDIKQVVVATTVDKNVLSVLRSGLSGAFVNPLAALRYILAALLVITSFLIGFTSFSRVSTNSLRALGRNPLASKEIKSAVVFNFILTFVVVVAGLAVSYLILVL